MSLLKRVAARACAATLLSACHGGERTTARTDSPDAVVPGGLTREQLKSPEACKGCHPNHYREWSSSMHAYATEDPVFIAMNERGQRETHGKLGDFCLKCHAPMAVHDRLTTDGANLPRLPDSERGVTCYFCHNVTRVEGDHDGMLHLADDTTLRGPIHDPHPVSAHRAEFSEIFDDTGAKSSPMCGGCHDIVTPTGVHLERTFEEYRHGIFSKSATGAPPLFSTCMGCHMNATRGFAANTPGLPMRTVHEHLWPGVDVALTDFPHRDALRSAVEDCELRASISFFTLEVTPPDLFTFQVETNAGHAQPSGAAQDRRMWLEVLAYDESGALLDQVSSGDIADGEPEDPPESAPRHDPHLLMFRDRIYDAKSNPVHMFWEAESSSAHPAGYESNLLPPATTTYIEGKHAVLKQYRLRGKSGLPARVTARLRVRPIGLDVLQDLVDSGDLDPAILKQMPTFTFGTQIEWTKERGLMKPVDATIARADCVKHRCLLDPGSKDCERTTTTTNTATAPEKEYRY
ncbi:MAG TPA: multiheme c-type cytochrome [Polyangiaceae bacterium]|nr:multiheme c-type cytochrome [Polyangiaceae bacterium]